MNVAKEIPVAMDLCLLILADDITLPSNPDAPGGSGQTGLVT